VLSAKFGVLTIYLNLRRDKIYLKKKRCSPAPSAVPYDGRDSGRTS